MSKPLEITYDQEHYNRIESTYIKKVEQLYNLGIREAVAISQIIGSNIDISKPFKFSDYPQVKQKVDKLFSSLHLNISSVIDTGTKMEWMASVKKSDDLVNWVLKSTDFTRDQVEHLYSRNLEGLAAFQNRKINDMKLSDRVWKYTNQFKGEIEMGLDVGLSDGRSAAQLSRDLRGYLQQPDKLFRRVRDVRGNLVLSKNALKYNPGSGVYRSSAKNALRLTRSEINMAYRESDYQRHQQLDFIVGIEVRRSNRVFSCETCNSLQGKYPKDFKFWGWHPSCYDELSEVLTKRGWQFFKDVTMQDEIMSLNPETKNTEWTGIDLVFSREYNGKMVHFHNKTLDCLVTPEHEMVYLNKRDGSIKRTQASDFRMAQGAFYRSSEYSGKYQKEININGLIIPFSEFCEFMGYWLSDGSIIKNYQITIAQQDGGVKPKIIDCIYRMGFNAQSSFSKINFYSKELVSYLKQFKLCVDKYVPDEIKNASKKQIQIFLNAFISCDGMIKEPKSFTGSRGTLCTPKNGERMYFTSSPQMASDIGEMIVKIGKRPSYYTNKTAGKSHKFKNGTYTINHDGIRISECNGKTATVFEKSMVDYEGKVYDVTLKKNAIMYIRRNGKCFWGSNCRCYAITILSSMSEFIEREKLRMNGEDVGDMKSVNTVDKMPDSFNKWYSDNQDRIDRAKSKPYFLANNKALINNR